MSGSPTSGGLRPGPTLRAGGVFLVFLLLFVLTDRLSRGGGDDQAAPPPTPPAVTTPAPTTTGTPDSAEGVDPGEDDDEASTPPPETTAPPASAAPSLPTAEGVSVQILNGTGRTRLARDLEPVVRAEGYEVVNTDGAGLNYDRSTVLYNPGSEQDARAFQQRFPTFGAVRAAPSYLSDRVQLHVIIGADFQQPDGSALASGPPVEQPTDK